MSCVFGFDVGSRLTGLAIGNTFTASARALTTIAVHDGEPDWTRLDAVRQAKGRRLCERVVRKTTA